MLYYADNGTSDLYCVVFALDEGNVLCSSFQEGSSISLYSLSAEEYDRLFRIAAQGLTTNYVYGNCHGWSIRAARNDVQAVEIPDGQTAQFWEAFKDVRLDYTKMIDPLPDTKPLFTVICFDQELEHYQIVFYQDRILWNPAYEVQTDSPPVKQVRHFAGGL